MLKALILCLSKSACIPQSATALYMTGKEAGKPQIMPAFPQLSPFSWMFKMLVFFWAARRLAVLSMQNEIHVPCSLDLIRQRFPCGRAAFNSVVATGLVGPCIRTVFAPGYPAQGYVRGFSQRLKSYAFPKKRLHPVSSIRTLHAREQGRSTTDHACACAA